MKQYRIVFKTRFNKEYATVWKDCDKVSLKDMQAEKDFYNNKNSEIKLFTDWRIEYQRA